MRREEDGIDEVSCNWVKLCIYKSLAIALGVFFLYENSKVCEFEVPIVNLD